VALLLGVELSEPEELGVPLGLAPLLRLLLTVEL
jgi:hypothetical protein